VALNLIDYASVGVDKVKIKFGRTVKISSLTNASFIVQTTDATPTAVTDPFKPINTLADYNTIARTLTLYWNKVLVSGQEYYIRAVNILDATNEVVAEEKIVFTKADAATPSGFSGTTIPQIEEILVEDNSVIGEAYTSYQIIAKNPEFYIDSVEPKNGSFYILNNNEDGRVTIVFNARPATNFLSNKYFKAQRKKIQKAPGRWENLETLVQMHSWKSEIYVDFPSLDATPSYFTEGKDYFEKGYKYRITVSKDVGV
jgi:hypothetical protein